VLPRDAEKPEATPPTPEPTPTAGRLVPPVPRGARPLPGAQRSASMLPPPPALSSGPDAMSLLKALRRRWLLASGLGLLAALVALVAAWLVFPTRFIAFSTLQVSAKEQRVWDRPSGWVNDLNTVMKTAATRFKSRDVILKALNKDEVRGLGIVRRFSNPIALIAWVEDELKVETQDNNELMTVQMTGADAEELVVLVNALSQSYLGIVNNREFDQRRVRAKTLQGHADGLKDRLNTKLTERQALTKGKGAPGSAEMMAMHQNLLMELTDQRRQLGDVEFKLEAAKIKIETHKLTEKKPTAEDIPDIALKSFVEGDLTLKPKLLQLQKLDYAVEYMVSKGHPDSDPSLRRARAALARLQKEVDDFREKLRAELLERATKDAKEKFDLVQEALHNELKPLEKQAKTLKDRVDFLMREAEGIGITTAKQAVLDVEIAQLEKQHDELLKQLQVLQVEIDSEPRVSLSQEAVWQVQNAKRRLILLALAPLAGLCGAAFGVAWWEFRKRRIHSTDEVALGLGMRVVGSVPHLPAAQGKQIPVIDSTEANYDHNLVESIDGIRTMLLHNASVESTQLVMVTSAVGGEGKTTLSSNLALSLARAGRRTLLVDCDLRRPAMHQLFEQTLQPGFSEVVLGEVELPDAVRPTTSDDNLWLLPAGQWDREVIAELAREHVGGVFERLKEEFDFIIIDSHPVLPATDSLLIGQHVDAVIVSLMRNVSQAPRVYSAYQRLATLGIRVFGAVVNGMPNEVYEHGYHYQPAAAAG
jgi:capsular exopolysaccharide synthesis family protein